MKAVIRSFRRQDENLRLMHEVGELQWACGWTLEDMEREIRDAEILVISNRACTPEVGHALRENGRELRWIHFLTAGFDNAVKMGLPEGPLLSTSAGIKAGMVSEHALALVLALGRRLDLYQDFKRDRRWVRDEMAGQLSSLAAKTACVVGLGAIGRAIVTKLTVFGARVIAVSRGGAGDDAVAGVEAVYPRERICEAVAVADIVIVATNLDAETRHMIGERTIAAMKAGSVIVNIARGPLVEEAALIAALNSGHLGGAALDVQETEPLPAASPLWDVPNLILTAHVAGAGSFDYGAHKALFVANLARLKAGLPLANAVDAPRVKVSYRGTVRSG